MSTSSASHRPARDAFSLIELLVVVAIIAILASLLVPTISLVREGANSAACLSNMRQFGMAFTAYIGDNDERWPSASWNSLLQPYINEGGAIGNLSKEGAYRLARCQSAPKRSAAGVSLDLTYGYTGVYYNSVASDGNPPENQYPFGWADWVPMVKPVISDALITNKAQKIALSEMWDNTGTSIGQTAWGVNILNDRSARLVHRKGSNVLCADIHVQSLAMPAGLARFQQSSGAFKSDPMWRPYNPNPSAYLR